MRLWWFRRFASGADSIHPLRARTPHECIAIQSYTFLSEEFLSTCSVPSYEQFLHASDLRPVYAWERRFLQYLQGDQTSRRWVLKAPDHAYGLDALFSAFPDALIIQTHRNPLEVLPSLTRLAEVLHGVFARPLGHREHAKREAHVLAAAMERFMRFRDNRPELAGQFFDVNYTELVAAPLNVVARIYEHFEIPLTQATSDRMRHLALSRSRYSGHRPSPVRTEENLPEETSRFEDYCRRFGIPFQMSNA